jgi:hypothetical protein
MVPEDKTFLQGLLEPVSERGRIITPGAPWAKVGGQQRTARFAGAYLLHIKRMTRTAVVSSSAFTHCC